MREVLDAILAELGSDGGNPEERERRLIPALLRVQAELGHVPDGAVTRVAAAVGVPTSRVYAVATFYPLIRIGATPGASHEEVLPLGLSPSMPIGRPAPRDEGQVRRVLARCGRIDPRSIDDYLGSDGYAGLRRALELQPDEVVGLIRASGLRGRGGAGFPVWLKWGLARDSAADRRYVVCNAAEGDPGAFMDRFILENDPHALIEGLAIAGYAIGASQGFIYIRAEYEELAPTVRTAVEQAQSRGILGASVLGSPFACDIEVVAAAGRYVCGEETALLNSMEGRRGIPRLRPPFPTEAGLFGRPTVINNVKTLANVPLILRHGPEWFAEVGTEQSTGTAVLSLCGDIARPGVIEVPMGISLRSVIDDIGGGVTDGRALKAVQTGGPLGGLIPAALLDTPVSFEAMADLGSPLGAGGLVVLAEGTCMVRVACDFARFARDESCGYCVPCRLGTTQIAEIVREIGQGQGQREDLELLLRLGQSIRSGSFCAYGQGAPNLVLSAIRHFRDEFEQHVHEHSCPAGVCFPAGRLPD